jgi:hypothetical protein
MIRTPEVRWGLCRPEVLRGPLRDAANFVASTSEAPHGRVHATQRTPCPCGGNVVTIVVGVAAPDGMILAADSRTTLGWENGRHRIASDSAQKVFPLEGGVGVATFGDSFIGFRTLAGLMDDFVAQLPSDVPRTCDAISAALAAFFCERFMEDSTQELLEWVEANPEQDRIGFLVAGYDPDGIGRIREIGIPSGSVADFAPDEISTAGRGVLWRGQTDVIRRLIRGMDIDMFVHLGHELPAEAWEQIGGLQYVLLYPITMQDAVDLATFLIRTTIDMQRFSDGIEEDPGNAPSCGGPVRVLAVTRGRSDWVAVPILSADGIAGVAEEGRA